MPDMNENAETQQEYLGRCHDCTAPQTEVNMLSRHILELQADKGRLIDNINELEEKLANADYQLEGRNNEIRELKDEVRKLKLLVSSLVYEINQIWDINEMNDDLRMCAEKIDREVQLSKMAEDNRMVISALGFAIVPPKPKLDVKEV